MVLDRFMAAGRHRKKLVKEATRLVHHDIWVIQPRGTAYGMVYGWVFTNVGISCLDCV